MAMLSSYSKNTVLDSLLYNKNNLYVALFTASTGLVTNAPTAEVPTSGTGYARQLTTFIGHAVNGSISPSSQVVFPIALQNWGTITHWAIMDAITSGNVIVWSALTIPKPVNVGDVIIQRYDRVILGAQ